MNQPINSTSEKIPVVILCGGRGTRLKEETEWRPKPMVKIGDRPILWHIMKLYASWGFTDFILCLGYKGEMIKDYFLNYDLKQCDIRLDLGSKRVEKLSEGHQEDNWTISLIDTGQDTATGGRLKIASKYIKQDTFLFTYGDGVANVDIGKLVKYHRQKQKWATVTAVRPSSRYGELAIADGIAEAFSEKPQTNEGWINGGFFVLNRKVFDLIDDEQTNWENEPLQRLAQMGQLATYQHDGFWQCMDTYREMEILNELWERDRAPWRRWE
ncbi:glucose-1-phosphate cytidylyltransferase [Lusitaniella coriacea]|uniref:glucose-1-phosphate cytidylyltransferase n=1 Tax=Lusitaniella coriacea TaxID=1983105 RepID=UPI002D21C769|nr:glucose-1-phosphate cytidylyltransferase [Lusitaniella coriacea]